MRAGLGASWRGPLAAAGWAPHPPPPPPSSPGSVAWAGPWGPIRGRATGRGPMSELSKDQRGTPRGLGWALGPSERERERERERESSTSHERFGRTSPKRAGAALSLHHQGRPCGSPVLRSGALSWHLPHPVSFGAPHFLMHRYHLYFMSFPSFQKFRNTSGTFCVMILAHSPSSQGPNSHASAR